VFLRHPVKGAAQRTDTHGDICLRQIGLTVLQNPVSVALMLLTGYYSLVATVHQGRSFKTKHALIGAGFLATLTTAAAVLTSTQV
jgi:hypothetical protein